MRRPWAAALLCLSLGGAAEAADIYYSVGTSASDLKTGAPTLTLAAGTATLTVAQTGMIGMGDVITYNGTSKVYIRSVLSQTQFATQTVTGGVPVDVAGATVNSIRRVFGALEGAGGAIVNARLAAYLGTGNLVAAGHTLTFVLYNDGPFGVTSQIVLSQGGASPYTTDATRYVTVTVASAAQVASVVSQRHQGRAGTGAILEVGANNIGGADGSVIYLDLPYTRVEWLELDGNSFVGHDGIYLDTGANNALLRNLIIHDIGALDLANCPGGGNDCSGIGNGAAAVQIRNCLIYDYGQDAIYSGGAGLVVANSTLFRSKSTPNVGEGLQLGGGTATAENVMALANGQDFCAQGVCGGTLVCNNCLSADNSADDFGGVGNLINRPAASQLVSTAAPVDLHLRFGSAAVNAGKDLSVSFTDDIDAQTRPLGAAWDIGADEAGAQMLVKSGTYVGNGTTQSIVGTGFRPDLVIITSDSSTSGLGIFPSGHTAVLRTSTMTGNVSVAAYVYAYPPLADRITSLDANGFSVGHPANHSATNDNPNDPYHCANHNSVRYYWVAFQAAPGEMAVGTYTGNGGATQDVTTVGFQPDYTLVFPSDGGDPIQRFRLMPANYSFDFDGGSQCPAGCSRSPESGIRTELANGFQVGQYVNNNAIVYHYVAWKDTPGRIKVSTYTGDGNDDRSITGLGFRPEMVQVVNGLIPTPNSTTTFKTASSGSSTDYSLVYIAYASGYQGPDAIQALLADGFQIGQDTNVNSGGEPHYYAAFGPGLPTAATTNYRSIGAAGPYSTGSVTVTNGSYTVTGVGTQWLANNRGRGDVLTVGGVPYTVVWVGSDTNLRLTTPYAGTTGTFAYTIARQFATIAAWENCIDGGGTSCGAYPPVPSASLVADDRSEVGIAYDDATPSFVLAGTLTIQGSTTDASHTILLTADPGNRHNGVAGAGVVVDANGANEFDIRDANVTVEWLEFVGATGHNIAAIQVWSTDGDLAQDVVLQNLLIHDFGDKTEVGGIDTAGIDLAGDNTLVGKSMIVRNTMIWDGDHYAIEGDGEPVDTALIENVSIDGMAYRGIYSSGGPFTVRNTIVTGSPSGDFVAGAGPLSGSNNTASDGSASFGANPLVATSAATYVTPNVNLHLRAGATAIDAGLNLGASFSADIDGQSRPAGAAWDRGADEFAATTEVELLSFEARPGDGAVVLAWQTASELRNLGFHLYRSLSASGPFERITPELIPGQGSSPTGASYVHPDAGLVNGQTYYYELEDLETTGRTERHGPISVTPTAGDADEEDSDAEDGSGSGDSGRDLGSKRTPYGEPEEGSFRILERGSSHVLLELWTPGFYAVPEEDGTVRLEVPGFEGQGVAGAPDLAVKRALVEALAGRRVLVASVVAQEEVRFDGLRVATAGDPALVVGEESTVQAGLSTRKSLSTRGLFPRTRARILEVLFQGETKKARVELSPLRHDPATGATLLTRRLRVRLEFVGTEKGERALGGSRGRRPPRPPSLKRQGLVAELVTPEAGLHAVRYEQVLSSPRGILASNLRLSRRGQSVAFRLEPDKAFFAPGSVLYFVSEGGKANPWGDAVYALEVGKGGTRMLTLAAAPSGPAIPEYLDHREWEENRYYQAGLLEAPDLWLWDLLVSPITRSYPFTLRHVATSSTPATLKVWLQGASDFEADPDHHLRVSLNGQVVGEATWDGKGEQVISADISAGVLLEGANTLVLENVGDTAASASMVFLNRFSLTYPRRLVAELGLLQGTFGESGTAVVGEVDGGGHVLDVEGAIPRWVTGATAASGTLSFRAEPAGRYLVVRADSVKTPQVRRPLPSRLRNPASGAEWLLVAPRELLGTARPLLELRLRQGLQAKAVALEEVEQEFGGGEHGPLALKEFLEYAYQRWPKPSLRYVVLLGDGTYDPKDDLKTGVKDHISPYLVKTSYLWTASDPAYGAVNGEDLVPDLAVGRLPASSLEQARALVDKVVAFETAGRTLGGRAVLIADDADQGGDFEAEADQIAATVLQGRAVQKLYLRDLAGGTRVSIRAAFDNGPGLVSYLGHGGTAVWASENIFNNTDVASLESQAQQPLLLTWNCLNGFFHFPPLDSLAEAFLKAEGKGVVAAFSPSGLSLDQPAHLYHQALLAEIESGRHARLGDALLAAQGAYADTGALPELLSIYNLFGDPGMSWPEGSPPGN